MASATPAAETNTMPATRVLIAGVGYLNLRDLSIGPVLVDHLAALPWPPGVDVEDLSYGPVGVVHSLREASPPYDRLVVVAGVQRSYAPGTVSCYRWDGQLPGPGEIQARVEEALTGVIDLDNLLIVTKHFGALPNEVIVVEVEPEDTEWGEAFSERIAAMVSELVTIVRTQALAEPGSGIVHGHAALGGLRFGNGQ